MKIKTDQFVEIAKREIKNDYSRQFLALFPVVIAQLRAKAMATFQDPEAATNYSRAIRKESITRLPELLVEFERNALKNGAKVMWARNAKEANDQIVAIAKARNITYVTKGKSMVTEEIGLNDALSDNGIEPYETDLGEFIAQQLKRPPFHIVGPAINIPVEDVCDLFLRKANMKKATTDPIELGYAARLFLRDKFHRVEIGITGVNIAVAETGTIINVENEGNIRFNKASPRTQISIMSIEKVVPTMTDAMHVLRLLSRNCTGQKIGTYVTMDSGPKRNNEIDGPDELFIIIVDNGRSEFYSDTQTREALRCIRCGTCLNICPVYTKIGGYSYGWVYSGPMGQILNPLLLGFDKTQDLYRACTLCGACREVCPGGIDHPLMLLYYRSKEVESKNRSKRKSRSLIERCFFNLWILAVQYRPLWNLAVKCFRPFINRYSSNGVINHMGPFFEGWFNERDFPIIAKKTFHERWRNMKKVAH